MIADRERQRHSEERGDILRTLKEDYTREMTSVRSLLRTLDVQGIPLAVDGLEFHLVYLSQGGYVQIWRLRDLPNWRTDRVVSGQKPTTIMFAKLTTKGLQLLDGLIPEDPGISF